MQVETTKSKNMKTEETKMAKLILETEYGMRVIRNDLPEDVKNDDILYKGDRTLENNTTKGKCKQIGQEINRITDRKPEKTRKVTSKTLTDEQIKTVNRQYFYGDNDEMLLSRAGYAFYYNQLQNGLDLCDADRYANLNTILGYDVGFRKFRSLDSWLWEHNFDLMELFGTKSDKKWLHEATEKTHTKALDYSKWSNLSRKKYTYSFFENGVLYK